ncbi:MAG: vitamin B12 dependent-methionine synthase activation domain-containing protein [Thermodesulfobacteriota bacterium]
MNETVILNQIPFSLDLPALAARLRIRPDNSYYRDLEALAGEALTIARPRAVIRLAYIDALEDDRVMVEGVRFVSRLLADKLAQTHRVFAYVATCGTELDEWASSKNDMLRRFYAEEINALALVTARKTLLEEIDRRFKPGQVSAMSPGSLPEWPIEQQGPLFELLGSPAQVIGVRLTSSFLMLPVKSVSGIYFPTETPFFSCQLCPREKCPGRKAPYQAAEAPA